MLRVRIVTPDARRDPQPEEAGPLHSWHGNISWLRLLHSDEGRTYERGSRDRDQLQRQRLNAVPAVWPHSRTVLVHARPQNGAGSVFG